MITDKGLIVNFDGFTGIFQFGGSYEEYGKNYNGTIQIRNITGMFNYDSIERFPNWHPDTWEDAILSMGLGTHPQMGSDT